MTPGFCAAALTLTTTLRFTAPVEPSPAPPISTVGIITADRPRLLRRCLTSVIRQLRLGESLARIIVVDGSTHVRSESNARAVVSSVAASEGRPIIFVGRREAQMLRRELLAICPERVLEFALQPGASGGRNTIALLSSGENVLLVDDDVVCEPWTGFSGQPVIDFCGHEEQRHIAFFKTRRSIRAAMFPASANLFAAHQTVLGRTVHSLAAQAARPLDPACACPRMVDAVTGVRPAAVRATFSGLAGDSGWSYPDRLLFTTGRWKSILTSSRAAYDAAFTFREVFKVADRYIVAHHTGCMAYCMGLANTSVVPPFIHVGRNQDGLFGAMLSAIDRTVVYSHVPYAVVHDSPRPARYTGRAFPSARETRLADVMTDLTATWSKSAPTIEPTRRLARLGAWLDDVARLNRRDFVDVLTGAILAARQRELVRVEAAVGRDSTYPRHWQRDLQRYADAMARSMRKPSFFLPREFHRGRSLDTGYAAAQLFIRASAELLQAWPTLWAATKARASTRP